MVAATKIHLRKVIAWFTSATQCVVVALLFEFKISMLRVQFFGRTKDYWHWSVRDCRDLPANNLI
jgi:hypothetical protein